MRKLIPAFLIIFLLLLFPTVQAHEWIQMHPSPDLKLSRSEYHKNDHATQEIKKEYAQFYFKYKFRDHKGIDWIWIWSYPRNITDQAIKKYGIPPEMLEPFPDTPAEHKRRKILLDEGMHRQSNGVITPDFNALIQYYRSFSEPLFRLLEETTKGIPLEDKIETLLRFVQDIPYAIPEGLYKGKHISGLITPPHLLIEGWGDCDTKTVLFASILAFYPQIRMIFIPVPDHLLMAIEGTPKAGQEYVSYKGKNYLFAAPVGPGRFPLGSQGEKKYSDFQEVIEIKPYGRNKPEIDIGTVPVSAKMDLTQKRLYLSETRKEKDQTIHLYDDKRVNPVRLEKAVRKGNQIELITSLVKEMGVIAELKVGKQTLENQVFVQPIGNGKVSILTKFYQPAAYKLHVYARKNHGKGQYPFVFDYEFKVDKRFAFDGGFPEVFGDFNRGQVILKAPFSGALKYKKKVFFDLIVPKAEKVAVIIGKQWNFLEKKDNHFSGWVTISGGPAVVSANYGKSNRYNSLLRYQVVR
jgi:hypothetical protein